MYHSYSWSSASNLWKLYPWKPHFLQIGKKFLPQSLLLYGNLSLSLSLLFSPSFCLSFSLTRSTCAASWARELRCICIVFAICRVHAAGSLMTANSGCRRHPSTDPRTALSTAWRRVCLKIVGGASISVGVSSEGSVGVVSSSTSVGSVFANPQRLSNIYSQKSSR